MHERARVTPARIAKVIHVASGLGRIIVECLEPLPASPRPGQFAMFWLPGLEEVPLSISDYEAPGKLFFTVMKRGPTTESILAAREGKIVGIRGPFGKPIPLGKKRYLLVAGGVGAAPMPYIMKELKRIGASATYIVGARTKEYLLFHDLASSLGFKSLVATDDGSMGFKGTAADLALEELSKREYDEVIVCGPNVMLKALAMRLPRDLKGYVLPEELVKCGVGACGSCVLKGTGFVLCRDGPAVPIEVYRRYVESSEGDLQG